MKLFPIIATLIAQKFSCHYLNSTFKQLMEDMKTSNFELLDLTHHLTSGMKSVYTQEAVDNLIIVRQSLGGAGFSAWSGIPRLIEDYSPNVTFEGDNTVMAQ
jgi:acyl-CoA oxidase